MNHRSEVSITRITTKRFRVQASLKNDERVGSDELTPVKPECRQITQRRFLGLYSLGFRSFLCLKANRWKRRGAKLQGCRVIPRQPAAKGESPEESEVCIWKVKIHTRIGFIPLSLQVITDDSLQALFFGELVLEIT